MALLLKTFAGMGRDVEHKRKAMIIFSCLGAINILLLIINVIVPSFPHFCTTVGRLGHLQWPEAVYYPWGLTSTFERAWYGITILVVFFGSPKPLHLFLALASIVEFGIALPIQFY